MEDAARVLLRKFLVITPNVVVAEDLREILTDFGDCIVEVFSSMADTWTHRYDVAFFAIPVAELLSDRRVRQMHDAGTRVIVLDGGLPESVYDGTGIFALAQPFRTEDVLALLEKLELAKPEI